MNDDAEALACACAGVADERKAEDIVVLHVGPLAFFTDYFVIATGRNPRQIAAILRELQEKMHALGHGILGIEGEPECGWVLVDLGEAVVHLFSPEARRLYDLELLWGEARRLDWRRAAPPATTSHAPERP